MRKTIFLISIFILNLICQKFFAQEVEQNYDLQEVTVTSVKLALDENLQRQTVKAAELQSANTGVNLPFLLSNTPSLVATSDDGLGVGYTYFRVRGTDHTRINMTVNGIPLNDSESQTVFWVNMTDFASSLAQVDVQRGVGTSTNGASAFGASLNMLTDRDRPLPFAQIDFTGGMYNTFRESVKFGTGLLPGGFSFEGRFSKVNSDGYLLRAFSDLYSFYGSASYTGKSTFVKLLFFGGAEKTYMAWDGVSAESLATNPRYNPAGAYTDSLGNERFYDNQTDNYAQRHAQLLLSQMLAKNWTLSAALHYTQGGGYYEQYRPEASFAEYGLQNFGEISSSDLVRQKHLLNHFFGGVFGVNFAKKNLKISFGGAGNYYIGNHFGKILWIKNYKEFEKDLEYYRSLGLKTDANFYAKAHFSPLKNLNLFGDLQYRFVDYKISGVNDANLQNIALNEQFHFFNPKAGVSYKNGFHSAAITFAVANREPARTNFTDAGANEKPRPERLFDYEASYEFSYKNKYTAGANLYFMDYRDQLVLTGQISDVGAALTKNVKKSYRLGLEILLGVKPVDWFAWNGNLTLSRNKILDLTDFVDDWDAGGQREVFLKETDISFSPSVVAGSEFLFNVKGFESALQTQFVSSQFLNNFSQNGAKLRHYSVSNLRFSYNFQPKKVVKNVKFSLLLNNFFNSRYASNGGAYAYFSEGKINQIPWFYAQSDINVHGGISIEF